MKYLLRMLLVVAFVFMGCGSDKESADCTEAICTTVFIHIGVDLFYENGDPVFLDSYEVREIESGKIRDINWDKKFNTYAIASDFDREEFYGKKIKLQFIGKIDGQEVVREDYTVTADCCHVKMLEGNKTVVVKQ